MLKCTLVQALRLWTGRTAHRASRGISILFLDHDNSRGRVGNVTPRPLLPPGKTRYPFYRKLGGPQDRSGQVRKISSPPGFDLQAVQTVASRYTHRATRPNILWNPQGYLWFHNILTRVFLLNQINSIYAPSSYFCKILITTIIFHDLSFPWVYDNKPVHPSLLLHACYMPHISYHHSFEQQKKIFLWVTPPRCFFILYCDQQMHNYFTNYHTPTCFDTVVSFSGKL